MIRVARPEIEPADMLAVSEVLASGMLVQGERVRAFEERLAGLLGSAHAVAVSSGTAALHLALLALGIGPGDEVVVPDFTFPASANVVELVGATPVLVDVELATFNLDPAELARAVTPRTKALMPVHLFGLPAAMDTVLDLARERSLAVVEDAACALGARYRGRPCGTLGTLGCFSFHPRKLITTGEGGLVVTGDGRLADRLRLLRNHGQAAGPEGVRFEAAGFNYRLTEPAAALGLAQLARLNTILARREALARHYQAALEGIPGLAVPRVPEGMRSAWQAYVVLLPEGTNRDALQASLKAAGIETTPGTYAVSAQPHFAGRGPVLPRSSAAQRRSLALPLHTRLDESEVDLVAGALRRELA